MPALDPAAARAVVPRAASTTLVVRDHAQGIEVLMVKRSAQASFMPGSYVFPGGAVDAADADTAIDEPRAALIERIGRVSGVGERAPAHAVAALRECREECALDLGSTRALQPWSRWVTPLGLPKRFDTLFFVARAPDGQTPRADEAETTTLEWVAPPRALEGHAAGTFQMEFATVATVRSLLSFGRVQEILSHASAQREMQAVHPRLTLDAQRRITGVLLAGQAGYDDSFGDGP